MCACAPPRGNETKIITWGLHSGSLPALSKLLSGLEKIDPDGGVRSKAPCTQGDEKCQQKKEKLPGFFFLPAPAIERKPRFNVSEKLITLHVPRPNRVLSFLSMIVTLANINGIFFVRLSTRK